MEYIYQTDFTEFPISSYDVYEARYQRDRYAREVLTLPDEFVYTANIYELFDQYTCSAWYNLDRIYCLKAAELQCSTSMSNKQKKHYLLVSNGNILYCREEPPTSEQISTVYKAFLEWNGSNAESNIGGFPFALYPMVYLPEEIIVDQTAVETAVGEYYEADESQQTESAAAPQQEQEQEPKPTIDLYNSEIPPPPPSSPVLRRSERLAKKKTRKSQRLSGLPRIDYSGME